MLGSSVPAKNAPGGKQQGDHSVAQALTEWAEELAILHIVASVQAQPLLPSLLLSLNGIKIPSQLENRGVKIKREKRKLGAGVECGISYPRAGTVTGTLASLE